MLSQIYDTRIKLKKDTEGNWTQSDSLLLDGELILVNTPNGKTKIKIGGASGASDSSGSGNAHNHGNTGNATVTVNTLQPYITIYMWKKTA